MDAQRLKPVPLFADLSKRQLEQVARWADEIDLPAGRNLVDQGTFAYEFIIILSGTASVMIDGGQVAELGPGEFLGEMALLEVPRRTATVVSNSPMRLVVMTGREFRAMLSEIPVVSERVRVVMDQRMHGAGRDLPQGG